MVERRRPSAPQPSPEPRSFPESEGKPYRLEDLAATPRWVAWRQEERTNKDGSTYQTKIPYDPNTGRKARVPTDLATYGSREQAERRWRELDDGSAGGVGIVLGDLKGVCLMGIDLDGCIDPQTEEVAPWADAVLDRFNTYAEVSPSGTGIKLFFIGEPQWGSLFGKTPKGEQKTRVSFAAGEHREIALDRARFYAVTGEQIDGHDNFRRVSIDDLKWFLDVAGPEYKKARQPDDQKSSSTRDESGSGYGFRFLRDRKATGDSYEAARATILADTGRAGEWARRVDERQLRRAWDAADTASDETKKKQIDVLIETATSTGGLFHDASNIAYVDLVIDGHRETWRVRSEQFKGWLTRQFWERMKTAPNSEALSSALRLIEAMARFDGVMREVFLRVADEPSGGIYLDLCDENWQAVWIGPDDWSVVKNPQVRFIRHKGMCALPTPVEGGSIEELRPFVNVKNSADFVLVIAWLLAALRGHGPYPVLMVWGEPGAAKSTLLEFLRALVDPNVAPLRAPPRENRDLFIAANNAWVPTFDNVSKLPEWLSDTLARLATGGGFATRQLYSDDDERLFDATRPILIGAIENVVVRGDLADRSVLVELGYIPDQKRRRRQELLDAFRRAQPRILGALLTAVARGLKTLPTVKLTALPRMADFAEWVVACEAELWKPGTFMDTYLANRLHAITDLVETNLLGSTLISFLESLPAGEWTGTATELLDALNERLTDRQRADKYWPKAAHSLAGKLTRLAGDLRKLGIEITDAGRDRTTNRKLITIVRLEGSEKMR